jgi:hypothetical protein
MDLGALGPPHREALPSSATLQAHHQIPVSGGTTPSVASRVLGHVVGLGAQPVRSQRLISSRRYLWAMRGILALVSRPSWHVDLTHDLPGARLVAITRLAEIPLMAPVHSFIPKHSGKHHHQKRRRPG